MLGQLRTHLLGFAGLSALVGNRMYTDTVPVSATLPALRYQVISDTPVQHRSSRKATYSRTRVQIDVFAANRQSADTVRTQVLNAMAAFFSYASPRVDVALRAGGFNGYEPETSRFRSSIDFIVQAEEA